jgi:hypothetical protein
MCTVLLPLGVNPIAVKYIIIIIIIIRIIIVVIIIIIIIIISSSSSSSSSSSIEALACDSHNCHFTFLVLMKQINCCFN